MKKPLLLVLTWTTFYTGISQPCSCVQLLDSLFKKTETNYAGYIHKVIEKRNKNYERVKFTLLKKAHDLSFEECYDVLAEYTEFFEDGHLFITEFPRTTAHESDSLFKLIKTYNLPGDFEENILKRKNLHELEGIWKDGDQKLAILKIEKNKFYGVLIQSSNLKWRPGMVKMEIEKNRSSYTITYYRNDFSKIHFRQIHIYKEVFLPFGPYLFSKVIPVTQELKYINESNPQLPVIRQLDNENILLTIPSALIERKHLDSLLTMHEKEIRKTTNLIIDLRGNRGGNFIWSKLYEMANTQVFPVIKNRTEDDFLMLASRDNETYFSNFKNFFTDTGGIHYYTKLNERIKENQGKIIEFSFYNPVPDTARRIVYEYPQKVAIITDKAVASAAEAFILYMKENSSKVITYGDNTDGMIDYMNVNTILFGCKENKRYYFGYPTFFSKEIKEKPVNPTGIKPDIKIPPGIRDWVDWVKKELKLK